MKKVGFSRGYLWFELKSIAKNIYSVKEHDRTVNLKIFAKEMYCY